MCGISAIVTAGATPRAWLHAMNEKIAHRGPDGNKSEFFPQDGSTNGDTGWHVGLGHLRLSIIDLNETGDQPMSYDQGELWIIFNGEIYNFVELKNELSREGLTFTSTSDTEVILAAYSKWGTACFGKMLGMWGIVIYDRKRGKVIVSRDRMGIKPLYHYSFKGGIAFASEIKQFFALPEFTAIADRAVVKQYLSTGFETNDRTFFKDVSPVLAGTFMEVDVRSMSLGPKSEYWHPEKITSHITDVPEAAGLLGNILSDSVRIHLRSDVPVGCQLSGGVDSSSVFALMRKHYHDERIESFTIEFPGYEKNEAPFVRQMLEGTKSVPHFTTVDPEGFIADLRKFIWHHDEPVGSFAHYAGFVLARMINSARIKVVLNGQGGDELLGGYWQQYFTYLYTLARGGKVGSLMKHILGSLSPEGNRELISQFPATFKRYRSRNRSQPLDFVKEFQAEPPLHFYKTYFGLAERERRLFEIRHLILPRLLKWDDRNLMAFGVEGRYPFLDHRVIETALAMDSKVLYKDGWTKYPLRVAMKDTIPRSISFRKSKWGFETPQAEWLNGNLRDVMQAWTRKAKPLDQVIEHDATVATFNNFVRSGTLENAQTSLRLFLLDQWLETFQVKI